MSYHNPGASYRNAAGEHPQKNVVTAYLLGILFGVVGVHRFYLGQIKQACLLLAGMVLGLGFLAPGHDILNIVAYVFFGFVVLLWIYDLIRMPALVKAANDAHVESAIEA